MGIQERIQYVMQLERLTAKDFADILGVQRSSISHLVSGRNKPSIDFLEKFLEKFPKYNPVWFISGKGEPKMLIEKETAEKNDIKSAKTVNKIVQHSIFEQPEELKKHEEYTINNVLIDPVTAVNNEISSHEIEEKAKVQNHVTIDVEPPGREIERIVLFFTDGTFETYNEKKKNR
jgi:transcriptional regulator with XRE-family HTH domain